MYWLSKMYIIFSAKKHYKVDIPQALIFYLK